MLEIIFMRSSGRFCGSQRVNQWGRVGKPWLTVFTRMRRACKSIVQVRANERTAAFVAL
jgi:hypothetical protein